MSNQRLMKAKEKAGDGYAKTNAIAPHGGSQGGATLGFSDAMNALIDEELVNAQAITR